MADIKQKWPWPQNVGLLGTFPDEVKGQRKLEKNPDAAPMPALAPTRLLSPKTSSDNLRMGEPAQPASDNDAISMPLTHVVLRRLLMKRRRRGWMTFGAAVDDEDLPDLPTARRDQMRGMLRREQAMLELLERYNRLAEDVYTRLLSESKG